MTIADPHPDGRTGGAGGVVHAYLGLRYVLTESLVVRSDYDPLRITTAHAVPGRAQRGMLAAALRHAGRDDLVEPWIARGRAIRFAPAFPLIEDDSGSTATVPAPRCWHVRTTEGGPDEHMADLLAAPAAPGSAYRTLVGHVTPDLALRAAPLTRTEQYLGVARRDAGRHGVPYFTTSLEPGQVFEARWQLTAASAAQAQDLAREVWEVLAAADGLLSLGSGGSRAHGGGIRATPVAGSAAALLADRVDAGRGTWHRGEHRDLLLLAPAHIDDDLGRPCPAALPRAAARAAERLLGPGAVEVAGAHLHQEAAGAYHRMYRGPMAERWAAAPGSVVRLRALRDIALAQVRELEAHPLGRRAADGHGAAALLPVPAPHGPPAERAPVAHAPAATRPEAARRFAAVPQAPDPERTELRIRPVTLADGSPVWVDPDWVSAQAAAAPSESPVASLQDVLLSRAAAEPVRARARDLARRSARLPPAPLLGRLREVVAAPSPEAADTLSRLAGVVTGDAERSAPHAPLHSAARADLEATAVPHGTDELPLPRWIEGAARSPRSWWEHAAPDCATLTQALAPVDLAWRRGEGATAAAASWAERPEVVARLALQLISTWLAAAAWTVRDTAHREGTE
ncbi:hypothetical protein [Streptomonospora litoralis]|uniref:CRISPR-associated protein Csx10 n=1 Tax=Streptomonospora litoralis TaxID=2498135 RepID=A0A4P6Q7Q8_9ACTN|nr:hypothetical protein [Streptomonospora litoralis]QBI55014.1 hypothetical protein EKD16_16210 [Streptomonospora litoralis]